MNTNSRSDIKYNQGLVKFLPHAMRPYWYLARLDRPIGVWLLLFPALWAILLAAGGVTAVNTHDLSVLGLFCLGAVVMRVAGCTINDIWDRDIDRQVARTKDRPIAAGDISVFAALVFLVVLLLIGFTILLQFNFVTILLGILTIPLILTYPLMKRVTWWPQVFLAVTFNFGALMGWSAITGIVSVPALFLYLSGIFWTIGYDTIYAYQDKDDDALLGMKSTARYWGKWSKMAVSLCYLLSWIFLAAALWLGGAGLFQMIFALPAGVHLFWQLKRWSLDDPQSALHVFRSNRDYGALVLVGIILATI